MAAGPPCARLRYTVAEKLVLVLCVGVPGIALAGINYLLMYPPFAFGDMATLVIFFSLVFFFVLLLLGCCFFGGWIIASKRGENRRRALAVRSGLLLLLAQLAFAPLIALIASCFSFGIF